jgi:uncharacterized membrane protein YgcG
MDYGGETMKTAAKIILIALLPAAMLLQAWAAPAAPVMASNNFYINDYAETLNADYRDAMLEVSKELFRETGAQLVVLTVERMPAGPGAEGAVDAYAERVFEGWNIGGAGGIGILLFLATQDKQSSVYAGKGLTDTRLLEKLAYISNQMYGEFTNGEYARGLYNGFYDVADELFFEYGSTREAEKPEFRAPAFGDPISYGAIFLFSVLILMRGWRVLGKRKKPEPFVYRRHEFPARTRGLVYNPEKGEYEEKTDDPDDRDDLPSGFGGAVSVKEHVFEEGAEPVKDFWKSQWDEFDSDSSGRN